MFHLFLLTSLLVQVTPLPTNVVNRCPQPTALEPLPPVFFYGHPDDCQYYFQCSFGTPYLMPCPAQTSFSEVLQVCVHRYSPEDTCAQQNAARECTRGASILADGNNCHRFYNCSQPTSTFVGLGSYQDECPYPQWFDSTDNTCKHYSQVTCSNRKQVKDKCDYVKNYQCFDAQHCVPCSSIFPSCIGRQDGIQVNIHLSKYYRVCVRVLLLDCGIFLIAYMSISWTSSGIIQPGVSCLTVKDTVQPVFVFMFMHYEMDDNQLSAIRVIGDEETDLLRKISSNCLYTSKCGGFNIVRKLSNAVKNRLITLRTVTDIENWLFQLWDLPHNKKSKDRGKKCSKRSKSRRIRDQIVERSASSKRRRSKPHPSKPWSPDYIECTDERVSTFTCPSVHGTTGFFSPDKNKCVSIYEVSQSFYFLGQLPSCLGKMPGTYPVTADPSVYFSCPGPVVGYCPDGYIFKELDQSCHLK
ncbi:hypothetical protein Btru_007619 [Bulinus truncatus]|nr:hypothetical protein Btru_007619 [Bulinus truncatus]